MAAPLSGATPHGSRTVAKGRHGVPNHSVKVDKRRQVVIVRVVLHKTPPKLINYDPNATHFYLDTLRDTRKLVLHFPYPEGIRVDASNPVAEFDRGILTATLPVASASRAPSHQPKQAGLEVHDAEGVQDTSSKLNAQPKPRAVLKSRPKPKAKPKPKRHKLMDSKADALALIDTVNTSEETRQTKNAHKSEARLQAASVRQAKRQARKRKKQHCYERALAEAQQVEGSMPKKRKRTEAR